MPHLPVFVTSPSGLPRILGNDLLARQGTWHGRGEASEGLALAILRSVSKAISGAASPAALFPAVCDAAILGGDIQCAAILLADPGKRVRFVAGAGDGLDGLRALNMPADPA